jgi:N-dimethylarginine dimethylaminohydrolase
VHASTGAINQLKALIVSAPDDFRAELRCLSRPATGQDAAVFGLNAVSDGLHVLLPQAATGLFDPLRDRGFEPVGIDLSELLKGGGSVKCCTQELRN